MNAPVFATLGCRLNAYETEAMKELAAAAGLENAVIVNTCAVTAEAVRKAKQEIRRLSRENPGARDHRDRLRRPDRTRNLCRHARSDAASSATTKRCRPRPGPGLRVPDLIGATERVQVDDIMSVRETAGHLIDGFGRHRAYVQVQNGCDHRCTFCIIPFRSRQFAVGSGRGGGGTDQAAGGQGLQRGCADRR